MTVFLDCAMQSSQLLKLPDLAFDIARMDKHVQRLITQLERAVVLGKPALVKRVVARFFKSTSVRLLAVLAAGNNFAQLTEQELRKVVANLDPENPLETYGLRWQEKLSGGYRPICDFGPQYRALQKIALHILRIIYRDDLNSYSDRGNGGGVGLAEAVAKKFNSGKQWMITADVANMYGSVRPEMLEELIPIPAAILRGCLMVSVGEYHDGSPMLNPTSLKQTSPLVLPQGACTSPILASILLADILKNVGQKDDRFLYADDILIMASTKAEGNMLKHALRTAFQQYPGGTFALKKLELGHPAKSPKVAFCHYQYSVDFITHELQLCPRPAAFVRLFDRIRGKARRKGPGAKMECRQLQKEWLAAFPLWHMSPVGKQNFESSYIMAFHEGVCAFKGKPAFGKPKSMTLPPKKMIIIGKCKTAKPSGSITLITKKELNGVMTTISYTFVSKPEKSKQNQVSGT